MSPGVSVRAEEWAGLIESIGPASVVAVIEHRLGSALRQHVTADDVFQEALLRAWRSRETLEWRGVRAFRSWLLTVVDHTIRDFADHHGAAKRGGGVATRSFAATPAEDGIAFAGPVATTTPSRVASYLEQAALMRQAILALPAESREVVHLRIFEQCELAEIATALGIGVSAVRHRLRRGAEQYRRALAVAMAESAMSCEIGDAAERSPD